MNTEAEGETQKVPVLIEEPGFEPSLEGEGWDNWMIAPNDIRYFRMPVYLHFGAGPLHVAERKAEWNLVGIIGEYRGRMIRSRRVLEPRPQSGDGTETALALFRPAKDMFVFTNGLTLIVYAPDQEAAETEARRLAGLYAVTRREKAEASFYVLEITDRGIDTHRVAVPGDARMSRRGLVLHYGDDFPGWEAGFTRALRRRRNTISVLQGEPGTGKTSFLRHLMVRMRKTHRFYFVPPNEVAYLLRTSALGFWINECRIASDRPPVLIIEDAETALLRRGHDNHRDVSNILNISDGLLGHCVHAHLICTINCGEADIDPAIIRPGRLMAWRRFRRLGPEEAARLAAYKRIDLPDRESHTLAEIYHAGASVPPQSPIRRAGFGAAVAAAGENCAGDGRGPTNTGERNQS
ncbi:MAG TPA: AAA family ATPase [Verrucomicrobiae bacterium]|nr:AAA family ATPase [Verrucomicrobiae bacterium]